MAKDLAAALAHLDIRPAELACLIEEREALIARWTSGSERVPRWLEMLLETWREHPQMLAIARENAAARLGEASDYDLEVEFA